MEKISTLLQIREGHPALSFRMKMLSSARTQTSTMRSCLQLKCWESTKCHLLKNKETQGNSNLWLTENKARNQKKGGFPLTNITRLTIFLLWEREGKKSLIFGCDDIKF